MNRYERKNETSDIVWLNKQFKIIKEFPSYFTKQPKKNILLPKNLIQMCFPIWLRTATAERSLEPRLDGKEPTGSYW